MFSENQKKEFSLARGRKYVVFNKLGEEHLAIPSSILNHALEQARSCEGEIWLNGRCVVPSWNVK